MTTEVASALARPSRAPLLSQRSPKILGIGLEGDELRMEEVETGLRATGAAVAMQW